MGMVCCLEIDAHILLVLKLNSKLLWYLLEVCPGGRAVEPICQFMLHTHGRTLNGTFFVGHAKSFTIGLSFRGILNLSSGRDNL